MKRLFLMLFTILSFFAVFKLYLTPQFPYTHDGENHLARFANYKIALREGQFPPRFAPNLLNGFGYPVFNYNYPLANILSVPFSLLNIHYELTFKILVIASLIVGAVGLVLWLKKLSAANTGVFLALNTWISAPYLVNLLYFRGNIGEILAYAILPWAFFCIESLKTLTSKRSHFLRVFYVSLVFVALLLSHNIVGVLGISLLTLFAVCRLLDNKKNLLRFILALAWSVGLTAWFWIPALLELRYIVLSTAASIYGFSNHFVTLRQFLWAPLSFGFSYPGSVDSLSFSIGASGMFTILTSLALSQKNIFKKYHLLHIVVVLALCILQLQFSAPIWNIVPALSFVQFPWRLGIFISVLLAPLIAKIAPKSTLFSRLFLILLVFQVAVVLKTSPILYFHREEIEYDLYAASTSTENENLPNSFTYEYFEENNHSKSVVEPQVLSGSASISLSSWSGSKRSYSALVEEETVLVEPTMNFPGWETHITQGNTTKKVLYVQDREIAGRIAYSLSPGEYTVISKFTQNTPARLLGNTVSVLALAAGVFAIWKRRG
ncbi:MAG: hypothetical protein COU67_02785 [Candidatus Pacebacteria bacterium CG10_big_fil_rev_8_21_14_0_10_44_54]|nr:hypothetical protein [Candidatus Paceibacterota bacterium]PIR60288.1 MAG: hypothetical protein COU67_02785 [Candidatus Pacebacteria bacterium CG10_big_fil_rev_8_21_14_0_10_44_54]